jgi:type IV pilus assembly protein PilE
MSWSTEETSMKRGSGFSLIEVLIALAILAIVTVLAYPTYAGYITKTRRIEGQIALIETIRQQESYFTRNNTYVGFSAESTDPQEKRFKWWSGGAAATSAYELRARACPGRTLSQCVEVEARPGTEKVDAGFKDPDCEALSLNSAGERAASGPRERCWL